MKKPIKNKLQLKVHIKKGDTVKILTGEDRGKQGRVLSIELDKNRAIIEGVRMVSRHTKPNAKDTKGGILKKEAPVHMSNLMLIDPKTGEPTRIGRKRNEKGMLKRYSKKTGEIID